VSKNSGKGTFKQLSFKVRTEKAKDKGGGGIGDSRKYVAKACGKTGLVSNCTWEKTSKTEGTFGGKKRGGFF